MGCKKGAFFNHLEAHFRTPEFLQLIFQGILPQVVRFLLIFRQQTTRLALIDVKPLMFLENNFCFYIQFNVEVSPQNVVHLLYDTYNAYILEHFYIFCNMGWFIVIPINGEATTARPPRVLTGERG
jgi:hypothetical protein